MSKETTIFGLRAVIEAIRSEENIDKIFIQRGLRGDVYNELEQLLNRSKLNTSYVPIEKLNRMIDGNHQGVVAKISPVEFVSIEELTAQALEKSENPIFILLDQLSDVRNFGAIVRTAECTAVAGIIIQKKGGAPVNGDTVKTSAGAIFKIPLCKVDHIKDAVYYLQASGVKIIAATEKTDKFIYDVSFKGPCGIIMGSEGRGINPSVLKIADETVKLPILGSIESLNVSVACGAILYEAVRQRL